MKITSATKLAGVLMLAVLGAAPSVQAADAPVSHSEDTSVTAAQRSRTRFADRRGDVRKAKLDIRGVSVVNRPDRLRVRVSFPGVAETYDFPTGAVMVYLDTDESRDGPEYGHFMDFWSDHRFAPTDGWTEQRVRAWSHSPEGRCVADAGVRSDEQSKLRWFEYVVLKRDRCFEANDVRVAVSTINIGELRPFREYRRPAWDHLTSRHAWTPWVPETD
ncbi:hypothetical protein NYO98_19945 [Nocardioides sp. STR2]|uniref:Uncharacterized protein n=1 Tax=Nocardioides pini TaxID=2975053 RepID=A0ABT4CKN3_9ACTN|nr:hypothetical protein [Nocardioides pini]MCY4728564.1 hypothetical protein [Nocardioides pini]